MIRKLAAAAALLALTACAHQPAPAPSTLPPPGPPRGEPNAFIGVSETALRGQFGSPAFIRKDGPTEMWRYDGAGCRAFFFLKGTAPQLAVTHVETMPAAKDNTADMGCLNGLKKLS